MFITSANEVVMFLMQDDGGTHHFITYTFPNPPNAIGLAYKDFAYIGEGLGGIIVGQVTSFEDLNSATVPDPLTNTAPSGFIFGL